MRQVQSEKWETLGTLERTFFRRNLITKREEWEAVEPKRCKQFQSVTINFRAFSSFDGKGQGDNQIPVENLAIFTVWGAPGPI